MSISAYVGSLPPPSGIPPEMPIISRGLPSTATALNNSTYHDQAGAGTEHAININSVLAADKTSVWLVWWNSTRPTISDGGPRYNVPSDYTIQGHTSSSGTKPSSDWTTLATVTGNTTSCGIHALNLSTYGWVRLLETANNGSGSAAIQIDIHDVSAGTSDSICFWGDSNPQQCYNGYALAGGALNGGSLETLLEAATGRSAPVIVNYGFGGATTASLLSGVGSPSITPILALPVRYVQIGGGTNDAANAGSALSTGAVNTIEANYQSMIDQIEAAGKVAILPTVPWGNANATHASNVALINARIPGLLAANPDVIEGPDLYALSFGQQNLITDARHFSYDSSTQPVTSSHPLGLPDGLTGYEAMIRLTRDVLLEHVYGL